MDNKGDFFGFKSFTIPVLLILGSIVIFYFLYDNYQAFEEEKQNERIEEARKLTENEPKELESNEQKYEKIKNDLIGWPLRNAAWNFDEVSEFRKFEITKETIDNSQRVFEIDAELQGYLDNKIYETKMVVIYNISSYNETIEDVYAIDFVDIYERDKFQEWTMTTNLNVDKFRNGDPIPQAKSGDEWKAAGENEQPAWCYYRNEPSNDGKYGKLYNWYAVNDSRGLAPEGYHIPTYAEWITFKNLLGNDAGNKMKSTSGWDSYTTANARYQTCPNCEDWSAEYRRKVPCHICKDTRSVITEPAKTYTGNGTNSCGFSGLPGGGREVWGGFGTIGKTGYWWSSTDDGADFAWNLRVHNSGEVIIEKFSKKNGLSVRCLRN
jgi:uncharacterized protein (TIGR02145 family)